MNIFKIIPDSAYRIIGIGVVAFLFIFWKFSLIKFVKIKISLPEDFMRQFRWITPLELQLLVIAIGILAYLQWNLIQNIQALMVIHGR